MRRLGFLFSVTAAALGVLVASASPVRAASLDGPPQIAGVRFASDAVAVSGLHVVDVNVAVRLTDQDGVIEIGSATCDFSCPTPALWVTSTTGGRMRQGVALHLVEGTAQDGWWQGPLHVGSLDAGELRVSSVEAYDSQYNHLLNADPASSGFDPRLTVNGSDPPSLSAGYSPKIITYGENVSFKGRLIHRDTGAAWPNVTVTVYLSNGPFIDLVKRVTTNADGYWGIFMGPGGGVPSADLPVGGYTLLGATIGRVTDTFYVVEAWRWAQVRWRVWSRLESTRIRLGGSTTVVGSVAPGGFGAGTAFLQRLVSGVWKTVASSPIHTSGRFYLTAHPPSRGYHRYRVLIPAATFRANTTPTMTLYVY